MGPTIPLLDERRDSTPLLGAFVSMYPVVSRGIRMAQEVMMSIQLTPPQQQALDSQGHQHLPRVIDPRTNPAYVLVPEADYNAVREILEDERRQRAIRAVALRNATGRMDYTP
jgi:hypothetical protein